MKYNEIISEDDSYGDYRQMTKFINRNRTPGVPADQQVALALYRELQKQQQQNNQLSAELSAAEKRIDTATQSGDLAKQQLGLHRDELDSERQALDKQRDTISKIDQQYSAREKASDEQTSKLTSQLETIKDKPGVSSAAAKDLEKKIEEIQKNGVGADKYQELEQTVLRMQSMQQVDDTAMKDLVAQVKNAQSMADELAKSKSSLGKDVEQTSAQLQTQLDQIKQQLADFREVEQTVSTLTPIVQDVLAPKVDKLYKRQMAVDKIDPEAIAKQFRTKGGLDQAVGQLVQPAQTPQPAAPPTPVAEDKMIKMIKWATSK
jgi:chromosome segregation ATPase